MNKVCYVIGQLTKGGAERQLFELVSGLDRKSFDPVVISLSSGGYWAGEMKKAGVRVFELWRNKSFEFRRFVGLVKLIRSLRPDIVHTYLFAANCYGRIAALACGVPVIIASERNNPEIGKDKNRRQAAIDKMLARLSNGIICNSLAASKCLIETYSYDARKVFTVRNGMRGPDGPANNPGQSGRKKGVWVVGTTGRLCRQKNLYHFLTVARELLSGAGGLKMKFVIIGEGEERRDLEDHARSLGIGNYVEFTGERHDVGELLGSMDVFAMTSLYEGLSNSIMEAMAAALPVVATDVGGNGELVIDGETGFLCPAGDVRGFARRIMDIFRDEAEAGRLGENGKKRIITEFGVEKMIKDTESIYLKLMENAVKEAHRNSAPKKRSASSC